MVPVMHAFRVPRKVPLCVLVGGGESLNSYHYVAGNLLESRDPLGLDIVPIFYNWNERTGRWSQRSTHRDIAAAPIGSPGNRQGPATAADLADVNDIIAEIRENILAENLLRARTILDAADRADRAGGNSAGLVRLAERIYRNGYREAAAVTYSAAANRIEVADIYAQQRAQGAGRGALGSSIYERMLYLARSDHTTYIGPRHRTDYSPGFIRTIEAVYGQGAMIWGGTVHRGNSSYIWGMPFSERQTGTSPRDTYVHELVLHAYEYARAPDQARGRLASGHGSEYHGAGTAADDNHPDDATHWLWEVQVGPTPNNHHHTGAWHLGSEEVLPYLDRNETTVDAQGNAPRSQ
jgi:hypothetical protein